MTRRSDPQLAKLIGKNAARFREEAGLNQQQVVERLGMALSTLSKIERGLNIPAPSTLMRLADIFGREPGHFYLEEPPPAKERERQIWMAKIAPGVEVDDDLRLKVEKFLRGVDQEQLKRLRERKGLPPKK